MAWLIVYGVLSLLTFVVLTISTVVGIKEANSIFKFPIYRVQDCLFRLILLSIFFLLPVYLDCIHHSNLRRPMILSCLKNQRPVISCETTNHRSLDEIL